ELAYLKQNIAELDLRIIPADTGTVRAVIDGDLLNTLQLLQMAFVEPDAGGAGNAFKDERSLPGISLRDRDKTFLDLGVIIEHQFPELIRYQIFDVLG